MRKTNNRKVNFNDVNDGIDVNDGTGVNNAIADSGRHWYVDYLKAMLEKNNNDFGIISNQWQINNYFSDNSSPPEAITFH